MGNDNELLGPDGMPSISRAEQADRFNSSIKLLIGFPVVATGIGFGLAYAVVAQTDVTVKIAALARDDGHWAFLSAFVFLKMVAHLNMYPTLFKSQVMNMKSANLRANMLVYEQIGEAAGKGKVVLVADGALGRYNRGNRSLHHFVESSLGVVLALSILPSVFPKVAFALTCAFAAGRVLHQVGYSSVKGYGAHGAGFAVASLAAETMGGLCLIVGLKGCGVM